MASLQSRLLAFAEKAGIDLRLLFARTDALALETKVNSFNTRTGVVALLSADVTGALSFTPYNATNPAGYISGINSGLVTGALGYTPTSITGLTGVQSLAALKTSLAYTKADVGLGSVDNTADVAKNVLSATKLATARNINGVAFDGTGDITITVADNAITYAKMQDVSAASRLLGRGSASAGDPQELTVGSTLKISGTALGRQVRGSMVRRVADWIGVDLSGGTSIIWDQEVYDTDAIHDLVTNPSRLTTPAGAVYVRCGCTMTFANLTAGVDLTVAIRKNGATSYDGTAQMCVDAASAAPCVNVSTGPVPVVGGTDYFEVVVFTPTDASVDVNSARSNFWMEVLE